MKLTNLGPITLFSNFIVTISSRKPLEDNSHAHRVSLLYKLITGGKGFDNLSVGLHRDHKREEQQLTGNKNIKGKYLVGIMLRDSALQSLKKNHKWSGI